MKGQNDTKDIIKRTSNDATMSKLGDIYQYYMALLECFKMKKGEKIQIEVNGDVSKISNSFTSFQMEVKHHIGAGYLIDRDVDLWKTLKNWAIDYDRINSFSNLILFTTANISGSSPFLNWNSKKTQEKLKVLKDIGKEKKDKEKKFREYYTEIFKLDIKKLKSILERFEISSSQPIISGITKLFSDHVKHIPEPNRELYIASMHGILLSKVKEEPHKWEVSSEEFELIIQEVSSKYSNPSFMPLISEYEKVEPPEEIVNVHKDKRFVTALHQINYPREIPNAICDYWRTLKTISGFYIDNPVFNSSLDSYKGDLSKKLKHLKNNVIIDCEGIEQSEKLKQGKKLYNSVMAWDAKPFGSINPNRDFFQKGIIHDIVDEGNFLWNVGDDE